MELPICDFCSEPDVVWMYPAHNFIGYQGPGIVGESVGGWAACTTCHELIVADNRAGLAERSASTLLANQPDMGLTREEAAVVLQEIQAKFFQHRIGPPAAMPVPAAATAERG